MINLWAMENTNRGRFVKSVLVFSLSLFFLSCFNIHYIYAAKRDGISNDAEPYRTKGYEAQQRGDIDSAIEWYQKASAVNPGYASPHNDLGILFETKGWLDRAEAEYEKALAIDPGYKEVHTNLALLYERKGELEKAAFHWMRRYKLGSPDDPWTQEAKNRLVKLGLLDKAESLNPPIEQKAAVKEYQEEKKPVRKEPPAKKAVRKKEKQEGQPKKYSEWTRIGAEKNKEPEKVSGQDKTLDAELKESLRLAEERLKKEKSGKEIPAVEKRKAETKAVSAPSNEANVSYGKAKDYYARGEYAKALDVIRIAKQNSADSKQLSELEDEIKFKMKEERIEDHYKEGMIHYRQKDFAGARKEIEAILSILPD